MLDQWSGHMITEYNWSQRRITTPRYQQDWDLRLITTSSSLANVPLQMNVSRLGRRDESNCYLTARARVLTFDH